MSISLETLDYNFHSVRIVDAAGDALNINSDGSVPITDNGGSLTVDGVDFDIRDLAFATDKVDVSGSEVSLDATTLAALENITVSATDLDIRDLAFATDKVDVSGSEVSLDATTLAALENITVSATDLDIRDLAFATDKVDVSGSEVSLDATTLAALENITVSATDLDIRNLAFATDKVDVSGSSILTTPDAYSSWKVTKVGATSTEAQLVAAPLTGRLMIQMENLGSNPVYLKNVTGVSTNDFKLSPGSIWEIGLAADANIFAICAGGQSADLRIAEFAA